MAETLRGHTFLPAYSTDRDNFLRSHTDFLLKFLDHFAPDKDAHQPRESPWMESREQFHQEIMERAGNLAVEMSCSSLGHSMGWDYCERTEITKRENGCFDAQLPNGAPLGYPHLQKFDADEKVADIVMFVRPPIYQHSRTSSRVVIGKGRIIANPVPGYDPNPPGKPRSRVKEIHMEQMKSQPLRDHTIPKGSVIL